MWTTFRVLHGCTGLAQPSRRIYQQSHRTVPAIKSLTPFSRYIHATSCPRLSLAADSRMHGDDIRDLFSKEMSKMYQQEVPLYGALIELVHDVNEQTLRSKGFDKPQEHKDAPRILVERHGAIRVGTAAELHTMRRLFAVMNMVPVGYYDLTVANVPVHSTAFRPIQPASLQKNPFRVFTSLLRLDLISNAALRKQADSILSKRDIFTPTARQLIEKAEKEGGLSQEDGQRFVIEALETFKWHRQATVSHQTYRALHEAHRLIADVVSFKGPHINHLTPRTLDIDLVQKLMPERKITPKETIEGPPSRRHPILLRQTSFKALEEKVIFTDELTSGKPRSKSKGETPGVIEGTHTARFGEIEQRGAALTKKGRALYDRLLHLAKEDKTRPYDEAMQHAFKEFPDDLTAMRTSGLAFFRYSINPESVADLKQSDVTDLEVLIQRGIVNVEPLIYEDFLPVSAAG